MAHRPAKLVHLNVFLALVVCPGPGQALGDLGMSVEVHPPEAMHRPLHPHPRPLRSRGPR